MTRINLDQLKVGSIQHTSGVFSGVNIPVKWAHISKKNEGFGVISGKNNRFKDSKMIVKGAKDVN